MISPHRSALLLTFALTAAALPVEESLAAESAPAPTPAAAPGAAPAAVPALVPVRIRVVKGIREAKPFIDPRLEVMRKQLSTLAWPRWEQVSEQVLPLSKGSATYVELPDGAKVALSLLDVRGNLVTLEVAIPVKNTQSRVTTEKGQRILHQVAKEKKGVAVFLVLTPWP